MQATVNGAATGSVYAALALAIVVVFRSTGHVNVAQGEMAMFSTFLAWALIEAGLSLALALIASLVVSLAAGMAIERVVIRPFEGRDELAVLGVTVGLFLFVNGAAGWIWGAETRAFPSVFSQETVEVGGVLLTVESLGMVAVLAVVTAALFVLFRWTSLGLAMRAVAENPASSRLIGIRVGRIQMIGWGMAALLGALAGALIAPQLFLDVNLMTGVVLYAVGAAAVGGFDSPLGALVGGWLIGVSESLASTYLEFIGGDLKVLVPLTFTAGVLLVRPRGLFRPPATRQV